MLNLDKIKVTKIWPDNWVMLNLDYCKRIFEMVHKSPGWIIDSCALNDKRTL